MYISFNHPVRGVRGRPRNGTFTFFRRNDRQFVRRYTPPSDPRTPNQIVMRERFLEAKNRWSGNLSVSDRNAWKHWANIHTEPRAKANLAGFNAYVQVELNRMALGLAPGKRAPTGGVPGRVVAVQQLPAPSADVIRFRLWHNHPHLQGARLLVETTPATVRPTRSPREGDLRRAAGMGAQSFLELRPSGSVYELQGGLHSVQPGERFALRVRLLNHEIVAGPPQLADWIRLEFSQEPPVPLVQQPPPRAPRPGTWKIGEDTFQASRRARELDAIQRAQLRAFWDSLRLYQNAPRPRPWRPRWLE